jgi:hypothetical protein
MTYTILDWLQENAQVRIRVPNPQATMDQWVEEWVPVGLLIDGSAPDWALLHTHQGYELRHFLAALHTSEEGGGDGR